MAIEFNPEDSSSPGNDLIPRSSKMVSLVMKTGLVRDEKQSSYVLLLIAVLFFVGTFFVIKNTINPSGSALGPEEHRSVPVKTPIKR